MSDILRIGTRGSPLALVQARETRSRLMAALRRAENEFEIVVIKTTGDMVQGRPLSEIGGKGLFTKELEEALLAGSIDLAVHSMKDMQTALPHGLKIGAVLPREDVRDAFISLKFPNLNAMPAGSVVGTSSLRRQAQLLFVRPDLKVIGFRGNVQTRLKKLHDGIADATFLAVAGLKRLGLQDRITSAVETTQMLPAVAQGAIGIEIRDSDKRTADIVAPLNHAASATAVTAERAFLARLEGSCRTPIAGLAEIANGALLFRGQVLSPDGKIAFSVERRGSMAKAYELGLEAADEILSKHDTRILFRSPA